MILQTIWNIFNNKLTLVLLLAATIFLSVRINQSYSHKIEVQAKNFQSVISDRDIQIDVSKRQLNLYYPAIISLAKKNNVSVNTIQTIVQTKYELKDSIIHQDSIVYKYIKDTLNKDIKFIAHKDCYTIYGEGKDSTTRINKIDVKDNLTTFIYRAYDHHFLFFRWGEYMRVKEYSECQKDTVHISNNIRIN